MGTRSQGGAFPRAWIAVLVVGVGLKALLLALGAFPFHADEAVVGLMARHILAGDWPAFFYGQAYMGSLDASLVALAYWIAGGPSVLAIRLVQIVLYALTIATGMLLAESIFADRRIAQFTGWLLAVPVVNVTLYTTVSLGGYGEALLIGNLLMLAALAYGRDPSREWLAAAWALLAGLGLWAFGITLVFTVPSGILLARTMLGPGRQGARPRLFVKMALGVSIGAAPWWWSAVSQGPQAFVSELLGSAIAGASPSSFVQAAGNHLLLLLLFGPTVIIGLRPPWGIELLALPLAPVAASFWLYATYRGLRALGTRGADRPARGMLFGVAAATLAGLVVTPFGADPSGRYFLPLTVALAIAGADALAALPSRRLARGILIGVLAFNLWGTWQTARRVPPGITTQFNPETRIDAGQIPQLAAALRKLGEHRGYTTYWVAYPLAFHSAEQLVFVPRLPYHGDFRYTERDNRYPPYNSMVESSSRVAYITARHPDLEARIRSELAGLGMTWSETEIGEFRIFHALSAPVGPEMLDLGVRDD